MRIFMALALSLLPLFLLSPAAAAQDTRYISDKIFVVLHRGPGTEYKWVARLTPGTRLQTVSTSGAVPEARSPPTQGQPKCAHQRWI